MNIAELIEKFLEWCQRHRAPATVRAYRGRLKSLQVKHGPHHPITTLTPLAIDEWLHEASHHPQSKLLPSPHKAGDAIAASSTEPRPYSPDTQRLQIVTWQRFQKWLLDNKLLAEPITTKLEKPPGQLRHRVPTQAETVAILKRAPRAFRLIYKALRQSGARPNELTRARIEDINHEAGAIILEHHKTRRKTGKPREIIIGVKLQRLLTRAIGQRTTGPIFLNTRGTQWTVPSLSRIYTRLRKAAGLPKDLCLYLARHEHGTKVCDLKGIHAAAQALGHSDIRTTQRYVHTDRQKLRENQDLV